MNDSSSSFATPASTAAFSDVSAPAISTEELLPGSSEHTALFLQDLVLESGDVDHFLHNLARVAADVLSRSGHEVLCGVTLLRPRHAETLASSSSEALMLDRIQFDYGDGPCLAAVRTRNIVHVRDTRADTRWPAYCQAVNGHGMRSILGVPIPLDGDADCGLNLYSSTINGFTSDDLASASTFAREASRSLRLAVRIAQLSDKAEHLTAALQSRTVIDLAAGVIMGQSKCSQAEAVSILKAAANRRRIKLRELAMQIVGTVSDEVPVTHFD